MIRIHTSPCAHCRRILCTRCVRICADVQGQFVWHVLERGAQSAVTANGPTLSYRVNRGTCSDTCPTGAIEDRLGVGVEMDRSDPDHLSLLRHRVRDDGGRARRPPDPGEARCRCPGEPGTPVREGPLCLRLCECRGPHDGAHDPGRWPVAAGLVGGRAIRFLADRLRDLVAGFGPDAVGGVGSARGTNEESYLAQKFARVVLGTNNVDCCARVSCPPRRRA